MRHHRGFTLLEVLLATSLMTVVATATLSWMTAQTRSARTLTQEAQALATAHAVANAIRDDLLLAVPDPANKGQRYALERQRLRLMTLNHMPGDEPGLRVVQWRQDSRLGALVREIIPADPKAKPITRIVSRDLRALRFNTSDGSGILFLVYTMGSSTTEHVLPVTRAGMP